MQIAICNFDFIFVPQDSWLGGETLPRDGSGNGSTRRKTRRERGLNPEVGFLLIDRLDEERG
jgi:hypothetical protein